MWDSLLLNLYLTECLLINSFKKLLLSWYFKMPSNLDVTITYSKLTTKLLFLKISQT